MPDYHLPEVLWLSFYSKRLYRTVATTWRLKGLAYLPLLMVLVALPGIMQVQQISLNSLETMRSEFNRQQPQIKISGGELSTPDSRNYEIHFGEGTGDWILIDPSGKTTSMTQTSAAMLVTKTQALIRTSASEARAYPLSNLENITVDADQMNRWVTAVQQWFPILAGILLWMIQIVIRLLQASTLALVGSWVLRRRDPSLDFLALLNLTIVSLTPSLIGQTLLISSHSHPTLIGFASFILTIGYFMFALQNARGDIEGDE